MEKTLLKGLRVLEAIARRKQPCGVTELAAELDLTKSNVYRLLQTLSAANYVTHDPANRQYAASVKLLELGLLVGSHIDVREVARPVMAEVAARTMENTSIGILEGTDVLFLDRVESPHRIRVVERDGERLPAHASSCGKVLLAHAGAATLDRAVGKLDRLSEKTVTDPDRFRRDLAQIRTKGFCFSDGEWHPDIASVAVPVRGRDGAVETALMISGPVTRITANRLPELLDILRLAAAEIAGGLR